VDPGKDGASPRYNGGSSARGHPLGEMSVLRVWDTLLSELEVLGPEIYCRPETEVSLGESSVSRECGDGIGGKVVWLKAEFVEKGSEKRARRESEAALEVRDEDYALTGLYIRLSLVARNPAYHLGGDTPSSDQPIYLGLRDVGALPSPALSFFCASIGRIRVMAGRHLGVILKRGRDSTELSISE
jgi:hypothetical protein